MAAGATEGVWKIKGGELYDLSVQQVITCQDDDGAYGCSGGQIYSGFKYYMKYAAILETDYPYLGTTQGQTCQYDAYPKTEV